MKIVVDNYINFKLHFFRIPNNIISSSWFERYIFLILLFISSSLFSADKIKWSSYQGKMTYHEAKEQCQSLNMRLPTVDELRDQSNPSWKKNGNRFWAVNEDRKRDANTHYYLILNFTGYREVHKPESELGVYCANVTKESIELDKIREQNEKLFMDYPAGTGSYNYDRAYKICENMGMRIPIFEELRKGYKLGMIYKQSNAYYWSSTTTTEGSYDYIVLNAEDGTSKYIHHMRDIIKDKDHDSFLSVICHR